MHPDRSDEENADEASPQAPEELDLTSGANTPQHIVLLTDNEYQKHHERLYVWEEAGVNVRIIRRA